MRLDAEAARRRFAAAHVARLATVTDAGLPHVVPIVFALDGDMLFSAVDAKPKSTLALRRLANIAANPEVAVLADHYEDDWSKLWWARADGVARIAEGDDAERALSSLADRYPQYVALPPTGPVIAIDVARWSGWQAEG